MLFPEIEHLPILSSCLPLNEIAETITENLYANDEEKKKNGEITRLRCESQRNPKKKKRKRTNDADGGANDFGKWHINDYVCQEK